MFTNNYLASYLVYGAQKTHYEHSWKIGISETKYSRMGPVGETASVHVMANTRQRE
jgi:hypothetical protein